MTAALPSSADTYRQRRSTFEAEEKRLARISFRYSLLRGALFFGFACFLAVILVRAGSAFLPGWWIGAAAWLVAFFAVLPIHDRVIAAQRRAADLGTLSSRHRPAGVDPCAPSTDRTSSPGLAGLRSRPGRPR